MRVRSAEDIGRVIREARKRRGWSQDQLAARIGASRIWISSVENGKATVELGLVLAALQALGLALGVSSADAVEQTTPSLPRLRPEAVQSPASSEAGPTLTRGGKPLSTGKRRHA